MRNKKEVLQPAGEEGCLTSTSRDERAASRVWGPAGRRRGGADPGRGRGGGGAPRAGPSAPGAMPPPPARGGPGAAAGAAPRGAPPGAGEGAEEEATRVRNPHTGRDPISSSRTAQRGVPEVFFWTLLRRCGARPARAPISVGSAAIGLLRSSRFPPTLMRLGNSPPGNPGSEGSEAPPRPAAAAGRPAAPPERRAREGEVLTD